MKLSKDTKSGVEPLIVLISGCTGAGKTTLAIELARVIGIKTLINTSMIREIQRLYLPELGFPSIHHSSYEHAKATESLVLPEYIKQTEVISHGVMAIIQRLRRRGIPAIIEGVNLLPDFLNLIEPQFYFALQTPTLATLKRHYKERFSSSKFACPPKLYESHYDDIISIGRYIEHRATTFDRCRIVTSSNKRTMVSEMKKALETDADQWQSAQ